MKRKLVLFISALLLIAGLFIFGCNEDNGNKGPGIITYTAAANNGKLHKETTTIVTLTFSKLVARNTLKTEHVTIQNGTGEISSFDLLNANADTRNLRNMVVEKEGTIIITINYEGIDPAPREVMVYKKLGFVEDSSITINDVIKVAGDKTAGNKITFARYDGEPTAIIPPRTREPITVINPAQPAFSETLVVFDPPLNLKTTDYVELRWIDMVWEGFCDTGQYDFENESTVPPSSQDPNHYTNTRYDLHNVQFYLEMTTKNDDIVRFNRLSETNTSTRAKQPVRFMLSHIVTGASHPGCVAWDTGHEIVSIKLVAHNMQLRTPHNGQWVSIKPEGAFDNQGNPILDEDGIQESDGARNPIIQDTYIISLAIDSSKPPPRITLYDRASGGWNTDIIKNPKMGIDNNVFNEPCGEAVCTDTLRHSRSAVDPKGLLVGDGLPSRIIWDPINISVPSGSTPYAFVNARVTATGLSWHGNGVISTPITGDPHIRMNFNPGGGNGNSVWSIPFEHPSYGGEIFIWERFSGIFVQGNGDGEIQLDILYIE